jgi:hypothetical protein
MSIHGYYIPGFPVDGESYPHFFGAKFLLTEKEKQFKLAKV